MRDCDVDTAVSDWVIDHPETPPVFQELGIDTCCGGKSLAVCMSPAGLDEEAVLTELVGRLGVGRRDDCRGGPFSDTVVCRQELAPGGRQAEVGWRCLRVAGAMPFIVVGVLASLTGPVAAAGVGVFAVSTFDTDCLFVKEAEFLAAVAALRGAGHSVEGVLP
jgi:hypothetical protein